MRIFSRADVERLLDYPACFAAVEDVFRGRARGEPTPSGVLGIHVVNGGFHVKAAATRIDGRDYFAAKINANFPDNPARQGLPTIQGMLGLFDAERGVPLAMIDSMSVTTIRTAAATAVAARHLSRADASARCHAAAFAPARARANRTSSPARRALGGPAARELLATRLYAFPDGSGAGVPVPPRPYEMLAAEPVEVQGRWLRVRVRRNYEPCTNPDTSGTLVEEYWIRYLDDRGRPSVWYATRGC